MNNTYEKMWKNHKAWIENVISYYSSQLITVDEDSDEAQVLEQQVSSFQLQLDKLIGDEKIYALDIRDYEEEMKIGE